MKFRKFGTGRTSLLIIAGIVWIIAGSNILKIGIVTWNYDAPNWLSKVGEASVIFLLFFTLVFRRLYYKHTKRIEREKRQELPFFFFRRKRMGYHGFYDHFRNSDKEIQITSQFFYIGFLYRTISGTYRYRFSFSQAGLATLLQK